MTSSSDSIKTTTQVTIKSSYSVNMTTHLRYNQVKYHIKVLQIKTNKTQMVVHNTTSKISYIFLPGEQRGEL